MHQQHEGTGPWIKRIFQSRWPTMVRKVPCLLNLTMSWSVSNVQGKQNHYAQAGSISSARFLWPPDSPHQVLQMSCLIPTLAWQQLHCQSPIRQHCPLIPSSKVKHCGGAESRLREEQKGCKAYYRDGNAEPSFSAWTWPLHLLHRSSTFLWIPKHFLYNKSNTTSSLLPTFH